jgi:hypothetical protein
MCIGLHPQSARREHDLYHPAEFEVPLTMIHRLAILGGVLMLPLGFVLWGAGRMRRRKAKTR